MLVLKDKSLTVFFKHIILAIKVAVAYLIPDQPKWVEIELAKTAYQSKLALQEKVRLSSNPCLNEVVFLEGV